MELHLSKWATDTDCASFSVWLKLSAHKHTWLDSRHTSRQTPALGKHTQLGRLYDFNDMVKLIGMKYYHATPLHSKRSLMMPDSVKILLLSFSGTKDRTCRCRLMLLLWTAPVNTVDICINVSVQCETTCQCCGLLTYLCNKVTSYALHDVSHLRNANMFVTEVREVT